MAILSELNDDVTAEILLRVAPDEPAGLFRASVVCKLWHRILSDPGFPRRYRAFHRGAPLLGCFYNLDGLDFSVPSSRFVATTAASPLPHAAHHDHDDDDNDRRRVSWALDCRHGRVLFQKAGIGEGLAVWDPITDDWTDVPPPSIWHTSYAAVVLCDVPGCDHRDCRRGGHFLVVCVCAVRDFPYGVSAACVYSSEDRAWRAPVTDSSGWWPLDRNRRPAIIGDGIYCTCTLNGGLNGGDDRILRYDLAQRSFSLIGMPDKYSGQQQPVLMENEDGSLGLAGMRGSRLYLWSRTWNNNNNPAAEGDAAEWVKRRVIKLWKLLPLDNKHCIKTNVIGFAEGVGVLFITTNVGVFTLELKSRRVMKVSKRSKDCRTVVPFISFFTPDGSSSKMRLPMGPH